jgi:hypothetical protein
MRKLFATNDNSVQLRSARLWWWGGASLAARWRGC